MNGFGRDPRKYRETQKDSKRGSDGIRSTFQNEAGGVSATDRRPWLRSGGWRKDEEVKSMGLGDCVKETERKIRPLGS